jgi:hypothetical protein
MTKLDEILATLDGVLATTEVIGAGTPVGGIAKLADYFVKIAAAASRAHSNITGQPIDLTKLDPIEKV